MDIFFEQMGAWGWVSLGLVLVLVEILVPGVWMLWIGTASLVTGAVTYLFDPSWQVQIAIFTICSILSIYLGHFLWGRAQEEQHPVINNVQTRYVGETYVTVTEIKHGHGQVEVSDGVWAVTGPDCPVGTPVRVLAVEGSSFQVELVS